MTQEYPSQRECLLECARYLHDEDERDDLIERLAEAFECETPEAWTEVVRTYFQKTAHVYCAAAIALADGDTKAIEEEITSIAQDLAEL